ncbi:serine hydrolase [Belliella kenyensis]|uniref:beta-lactamase n=1 Tax=Belliella kenyensis TaxID=1472724 RepID=A0ABV8ETH9_9BACT|nr:serine hydrolase [Belliella kenyensis]MCH7402629.1 class A beta-lactamase-related serine hydrolase [Belliella kenyensis]MDN3603427.1 serine hydrolase [Belliella kenyensis]
MKKTIYLYAAFLFFIACEPRENLPFENVGDTFPVLKSVLENTEKYQVQILYSQINVDNDGKKSLDHYSFNLNDNQYFYPASTVKLPVAILALEWLAEQKNDMLSMDSPMQTDSIRPSQSAAQYDSSAFSGFPSIGHYIKKILLVSDNDAYNRLYELLGQDYINSKLSAKGLANTIINHRLSIPMSPEENRQFNPITFYDDDFNPILHIPSSNTQKVYQNSNKPHIGKAYYENGEKIEKSMDFSFKNRLSISDLHGIIQRVVFPEMFSKDEQFHITESDRDFLLKYMSMYPKASDYPAYPETSYPDSYSKFYKFGTSSEPIPKQFKIYNKTGQAYGHLLDSSYIVDEDEGIEFLVSAVIYVNENETLNDNQYEYDQIGFPFFTELGEYLYQLELKRKL